jgi:hypothetical protein
LLAGIICAVVALGCARYLLRRAPAPLRTPLGVFIVFYVLTTCIGATILAVPLIRDLWAATYPTMDSKWITPGDSWGYWFMVWGPVPVTGAAALWFYPLMRKPATLARRWLGSRVDVLTATIVGAAMCVFCFVNLSLHGYSGVSLFTSEGFYRENIALRVEMFDRLGTAHFAAIYMGIPAVAILALCNAVRSGKPSWWLLFAALSVALVLLYAATLTKANVLIYGIEVVVAAQILGIMRLRGLITAVVGGILVLTASSALLAGGDSLDLAIAGYNIIFREASDVPFYLAVFPAQLPFVGIDLGLGAFGIGPTVPSNQMVANFMYPHETWTQGAAPAAAHVMAYAQAGYPWSFVTMVLVGAWIAVAGQMRRWVRNPVAFSAFIGAVTACYYLSQGDLVGAFNVSYGYKWWIAALLLLIGTQRVLELALRAPGLASEAPVILHDNPVD